MAKPTISQKVASAEAELKAMTTVKDLRDWAIANGMDNRSAFPKFKKALLEIGIDYNAIRSGRTAERKEELASAIRHQVTMYSDAKASQDRYGITDADGNPLWYGKFFDSDRDYDGEQSSGELAAANKAIWLASKVAEAVGDTAILLHLYVDAQWLLYRDNPKQKGFALTRQANRLNVELKLHWIPGKDNPADEWTVSSGYQKWSDNDLKALAAPISEEVDTPKTDPKEFLRKELEMRVKTATASEPALGDETVFTDSTYQGAGRVMVAVKDGMITGSLMQGDMPQGYGDELIREVFEELVGLHDAILTGMASGTQFFADSRDDLKHFADSKVYQVPNMRGGKTWNFHALPPKGGVEVKKASEVESVPDTEPKLDTKTMLMLAQARARRVRVLALMEEEEEETAVDVTQDNATKQDVVNAMTTLRKKALEWAEENKQRFGDIESMPEQADLMNEFESFVEDTADAISIRFEEMNTDTLNEVIKIDSISVQSGSNYLSVTLTDNAVEDLVDRGEISDDWDLAVENAHSWEIRISDHDDYHLPAMGLREQVRYKR